MRHSVVCFLSGAGVAAGIVCLHTDSYGSLDGYVAHLRQPGVWVQGPWVTIASVVAVAVGILMFALSANDESKVR